MPGSPLASSSPPPANMEEFITPDDADSDEPNDGDSMYSSGTEGSTASMVSSVVNYKYENGRRYHSFKAGTYFIPNDEKEQDRLDMTHHFYLLLTGGKLYLAPLTHENPPNRILDLGTGTGIWAINIAEEFPESQVIATDLSPIQPNWVPPNLQFEVDDAEDTWTWSNGTFDYIHIRGLLGAVKNWPKLLNQSYDALAPGGWLEIIEHDYVLHSDDDTYPANSATRRYLELLVEASHKAGQPFTDIHGLKSRVVDAGFQNVDETKLKAPWGPWAKEKRLKEMGFWTLLILETGFESFGLALMTRVLGMDKTEVDELSQKAFAELKSRKLHIYLYNHFIIGQKPLDDDQ